MQHQAGAQGSAGPGANAMAGRLALGAQPACQANWRLQVELTSWQALEQAQHALAVSGVPAMDGPGAVGEWRCSWSAAHRVGRQGRSGERKARA